MYQSKIFANGSTTLLKLVREAPGVKAGDTVRYVIHEDGVQVLRTPSVSELADMLARNGQEIVSLDAMQNAIIQGATESGKSLSQPSTL